MTLVALIAIVALAFNAGRIAQRRIDLEHERIQQEEHQ